MIEIDAPRVGFNIHCEASHFEDPSAVVVINTTARDVRLSCYDATDMLRVVSSQNSSIAARDGPRCNAIALRGTKSHGSQTLDSQVRNPHSHKCELLRGGTVYLWVDNNTFEALGSLPHTLQAVEEEEGVVPSPTSASAAAASSPAAPWVRWQYDSDAGWAAYGAGDCTALVAGGGTGTVQLPGCSYNVNLDTMEQTHRTEKARKTRKVRYQAMMWYWKGDKDWTRFVPQDEAVIAEAFLANATTPVSLVVAPYSVSLVEMKQRHNSDQSRHREIRGELNGKAVVALQAKPAAPTGKLKSDGDTLWANMVGPWQVSTQQAVIAWFNQSQKASGDKLKCVSAVKLVNESRLQAFVGGANDRLLFHGCAQESATNIQHTGLLMQFAGSAHGSNLGHGLYGAPDPRKSIGYCSGKHGKFMFLGIFNLDGAKSANTGRKMEEWCVSKAEHAVLLWMLKVEGDLLTPCLIA